jgi:hypothetical protein
MRISLKPLLQWPVTWQWNLTFFLQPFLWNSYGTAFGIQFWFGNFWNLWISVDWKPWNFVQKPWSFGQTSRILEHFWNIFGNLGISVHSVFLVQVNNGYGTNSNHIRMKKPPLTRGTAGPEFPYSNSKKNC